MVPGFISRFTGEGYIAEKVTLGTPLCQSFPRLVYYLWALSLLLGNRGRKHVRTSFLLQYTGRRVETQTIDPSCSKTLPSPLFIFVSRRVGRAVVFCLNYFSNRSSHPQFRKYFTLLRLGIPREEVGELHSAFFENDPAARNESIFVSKQRWSFKHFVTHGLY